MYPCYLSLVWSHWVAKKITLMFVEKQPLAVLWEISNLPTYLLKWKTTPLPVSRTDNSTHCVNRKRLKHHVFESFGTPTLYMSFLRWSS